MPATRTLTAKSSEASSSRLVSLDVFRGATIAAMILVNNPGDEQAAYWPLKHAEWNGWTPTDLVFPFFLFIVGVAMAFSFSSRLDRGASKMMLFRHVLWRGFLLFGIGLVLNGALNLHLDHWRVYGVLQRIAICYVVAAVFSLWTGPRTWIATTVACLIGYWILMRYVPVPGFGIPGHDVPFLDPNRNLAAWLDRKLLAGHLYNGTRDPEGVLSTIPAVAKILLGLLTGSWLRSQQTARVKAQAMALAGMCFFAAGEWFSIWFPINKNLWTSSYVLLTTGLALLALALCYTLVDIRKWRAPVITFFLVFGMNAIAAYVLAEVMAIVLYKLSAGDLTAQEFIYQHVFAGLASSAIASLIYSIAFVLFCWAAMLALYREKRFLKI
jgi:predicted acyltransferase